MNKIISENSTFCPSSPIKEFLPINPGFYYTREVYVSLKDNVVEYSSYLPCNYTSYKRPNVRYGRAHVERTKIVPTNLPVYSNVAVISTRHFAHNIFHFMESVNMLLHYLLVPSLPPVSFSFDFLYRLTFYILMMLLPIFIVYPGRRVILI